MQVAAVVTARTGCCELLFGAGLETAWPWLSLVLSAALGLLFGMLLGGLWFGYWIRQEGLQLTHLLLVVWVLANFFVLNVRWN
ncbi:DUF2165 family protein [Pseudomonas aeruginosa]|nr:DUF2165 family protein [Pseudomonas aeruginosa]MCD2798600.1 DUF2165 family protein [Pseudomonas aeruginosa]MCD2953643.1 DUF2165 family protein [Pseudomonas aeruginosa]